MRDLLEQWRLAPAVRALMAMKGFQTVAAMILWLLVECAQHYAAPPKVRKELSRRQEGQPQEVRAISWRAQNRLHRRYRRLLGRRLQRNKAMVAIARELCGFIWELLGTQSCYKARASSL